MPRKPLKPCMYPGCVRTVEKGYCEAHASSAPIPRARAPRPSAAARGYNAQWQTIRAQVLQAAGIPRELWPQYDVHHEPAYNPAVEPDHRVYKLTPMLRGDHSRLTGRGRG